MLMKCTIATTKKSAKPRTDESQKGPASSRGSAAFPPQCIRGTTNRPRCPQDSTPRTCLQVNERLLLQVLNCLKDSTNRLQLIKEDPLAFNHCPLDRGHGIMACHPLQIEHSLTLCYMEHPLRRLRLEAQLLLPLTNTSRSDGLI